MSTPNITNRINLPNAELLAGGDFCDVDRHDGALPPDVRGQGDGG